MIFLFTDFGARASYTGQMEAVLRRAAPEIPLVSLTAEAPAFDPYRAAYLLAADSSIARPGDVVLAVVDPGVGTERRAIAMLLDGVWYVGPDNGLFAIVGRRAQERLDFEITWRPETMAPSFHGRDLFAPVAAELAQHRYERVTATAPSGLGDDWPDDLDEIVFVDDYGNAMTGRRALTVASDARIEVPGHRAPLGRGVTFADDDAGTGFWYENAVGLIEISIREGAAATRFGLRVGSRVHPVLLPAA